MAEYSELLIRILGAFLVLILGLIVANVLSNILRKFLRGIEISRVLEDQLHLKIKLENYLSTLLKYIIYLITIILILDQLGIPTKILQIILIVFIIIIIVFAVLAFKDWLPNLLSGFYVIRTQKVKKGETIKVKGIKGKVTKINLLETEIETNNKEVIFIPNSNLTKFELVKEKKQSGKSIRTSRN